jgi:hypothetical protein
MKQITVLYNDTSQRSINLTFVPDECPLCHRGTDPHTYFAYCDKNKWTKDDCLQVLYRCTWEDCQGLFITYYSAQNNNCDNFPNFNYSKPAHKKDRTFSKTIQDISPSFITIYNQANSAEQDGLMEICGVGYRKAIEFLIKDYLIGLNNSDKEKIEEMRLGTCIEEKLDNLNIKAMAKRATWLGNDETHYRRKWVNKDLTDLKRLIDATISWIELVKLTEDTQSNMPDNKKNNT